MVVVGVDTCEQRRRDNPWQVLVMSETLTILMVQAMSYYYRGNVKAADVKLSLAISALKKARRLHQLDHN